MRLFDTSSKRYQQWEPDKEVRMYVCGITPYDSAHLGHIFTFMTYDLVQRYMESRGHTVMMVRNITDVDDPIYKRAAEMGVRYDELAHEETLLFQGVMKKLYMKQPAAEPLASDYVAQMAESVSRLLTSGHAYYVDKDIYFDTSKDPQFGDFSGFHEGLLHGLMRKRGGDVLRSGKRQPLDFLLWKTIEDTSDPAAWDTTIGRGRPGWHIECTVMSGELLGMPFDLHGGGNDLIFPHHECELAQGRALGAPQLARHWLHVAPMLYGGEKMSKSLGNLVFARDLLDTFSPAAIRLALMHYHYREGGEWIPELLDEATDLLERLTSTASPASSVAARLLYESVSAALEDDLDTHSIIHCLEDFARDHQAGHTTDPATVPGSDGKTLADTLGLLGLIDA